MSEPKPNLRCVHCGKETPPHSNYCDWDCMVAHAKAEGGVVFTPNGLPIKSIKFDSTMLEHSHGDHPDYKFPVDVEFVGKLTDDHYEDYKHMAPPDAPKDEESVRRVFGETHALIYTDGSIAVTLYECNYSMFHLREGEMLCDTVSPNRSKQFQLTDESLDLVRKYGRIGRLPKENP